MLAVEGNRRSSEGVRLWYLSRRNAICKMVQWQPAGRVSEEKLIQRASG